MYAHARQIFESLWFGLVCVDRSGEYADLPLPSPQEYIYNYRCLRLQCLKGLVSVSSVLQCPPMPPML